MLSDGDLNNMRTVAEQALPGTCVVQTQAYVSDGGGEGTFTYTAAGTVACRVAPLGGDERTMGGRISPDADSIITLPHDVTISENSQILTLGGTYSVQHIRDRSWEITTRVEARKEV